MTLPPGVWNLTRFDQSVWTATSVPYDPLLEDYTALVDAVVDLIRDKQVDAAQARLFIRQAHDEIQHELLTQKRGEPPYQMLVRATTTTTDNGTVSLPPNFIKARDVRINDVPSRYVSPESIPENSSGLGLAPVLMDYYERMPVLSEANPTNWLLAISPSTYLYRCGLVYVPWAQREEKYSLWARSYNEAITALMEANTSRPRGGFASFKARPYWTGYSIIGSALVFVQGTSRRRRFT